MGDGCLLGGGTGGRVRPGRGGGGLLVLDGGPGGGLFLVGGGGGPMIGNVTTWSMLLPYPYLFQLVSG